MLRDAVRSRNAKLVKLVLDHVTDRDDMQWSIRFAIESRNVTIAQMLFDDGVNLKRQKSNVMQLAIRHKFPDLQLLIDNGAKLAPSLVEDAIYEKSPKTIEILVRNGIDLNDSDINNALLSAVIVNDVKIPTFL